MSVLFGGMKGFEEPCFNFLGNTGAVVGNANLKFSPRAVGIAFRGRGKSGVDPKGAPIGHGFGGVLDEIEQNLHDLVGIDLYRG